MPHTLAIALIFLSSLLAACQIATPTETTVATPEIFTPTTAPTAPIVATNTLVNTIEPTAVPATAEPSAEPSATATITPSPTPTNTPIPESAVDSIKLLPVLEGVFSRPLYLTHAADDRLFIVEQAGVIRIVKDGQLLEEPFLDIRDRVASIQLEQGLLSVAFHPDYSTNGRFFVNYTDLSGTTQLSSFLVTPDNPDQADAKSEIILLSIDQPYPNHNGGQLQFGPDGYLYVGVGDGGSANDPLLNGQDPSTLLGTLLRLDVDHSDSIYAIPATNPFVDDDSRRNEIWAWGLRNPWRFSFDRLTGDLFIADVGQNLWEEIHFQDAMSQGGENYGWNILEGSHCFLAGECDTEGLELPIFEYNHQEGCSVTGGYVYRGHEFLTLYGNYFLADFCSGKIWRIFQDPDGSWSAAPLLDTDQVISSFGEDVNGELYLLDHVLGSLYQLQP